MKNTLLFWMLGVFINADLIDNQNDFFKKGIDTINEMNEAKGLPLVKNPIELFGINLASTKTTLESNRKRVFFKYHPDKNQRLEKSMVDEAFKACSGIYDSLISLIDNGYTIERIYNKLSCKNFSTTTTAGAAPRPQPQQSQPPRPEPQRPTGANPGATGARPNAGPAGADAGRQNAGRQARRDGIRQEPVGSPKRSPSNDFFDRFFEEEQNEWSQWGFNTEEEFRQYKRDNEEQFADLNRQGNPQPAPETPRTTRKPRRTKPETPAPSENTTSSSEETKKVDGNQENSVDSPIDPNQINLEISEETKKDQKNQNPEQEAENKKQEMSTDAETTEENNTEIPEDEQAPNQNPTVQPTNGPVLLGRTDNKSNAPKKDQNLKNDDKTTKNSAKPQQAAESILGKAIKTISSTFIKLIKQIASLLFGWF